MRLCFSSKNLQSETDNISKENVEKSLKKLVGWINKNRKKSIDEQIVLFQFKNIKLKLTQYFEVLENVNENSDKIVESSTSELSKLLKNDNFIIKNVYTNY